MRLLQLLIAAAIKAGCLASFVWLVLHDHAGWASPLLVLFLLTSLETKPAPRPAPAPAPIAKP